MSKLSITVGKEGSEKDYVFEYTRDGVCKAEEVFGISLLKDASEFKAYSEMNKFIYAIIFAGLVKYRPDLNATNIASVYDDLTGEDGYESEVLLEGLAGLMTDALNPKGGSRKKKFPKMGK